MKQKALDCLCHEVYTVESDFGNESLSENPGLESLNERALSDLVINTALILDDAELGLAPGANYFHNEALVHECFMLSRPTQSYITRTIIDFNFNTFPRKPHNYVVTAADTASSLQLAVKELLYNLRDEEVGDVLGSAGAPRNWTASVNS